MSIEISNTGINHSLTPKTSEATSESQERNQPNHKVATQKSVEPLQLTENAKNLSKMHKTVSNLPVVDPNRVEAATNKVKTRSMDILMNTEKLLKSAENIARRIMIDEGLDVDEED